MGREVWEGKKYKLTQSINFEEFMLALGKSYSTIRLGVGYLLRKLASSVTPVIELTHDRNREYYTLIQSTSIRTIKIRFKPGVEFVQGTPDGRNPSTVINFENENTLSETQVEGEREIKIIREFGETILKMTLTCKNVSCTRIYEILEENTLENKY